MTAVEQFIIELRKYGSDIPKKLEEQAKELARLEIVYAYTYGQKNIIDIVSKELKFSFAKTNEELRKIIENNEDNEDANKYYNETYKKTK